MRSRRDSRDEEQGRLVYHPGGYRYRTVFPRVSLLYCPGCTSPYCCCPGMLVYSAAPASGGVTMPWALLLLPVLGSGPWAVLLFPVLFSFVS